MPKALGVILAILVVTGAVFNTIATIRGDVVPHRHTIALGPLTTSSNAPLLDDTALDAPSEYTIPDNPPFFSDSNPPWFSD
jgi:hypothetical protein